MLTDGQTDRQMDRRTSSIHKLELLCNPAENYMYSTVLVTMNVYLKYKSSISSKKEAIYMAKVKAFEKKVKLQGN